MSAFAEEADAAATYMQPRPHPVSAIRGRGDGRRRDRQTPEPGERIADDLTLEPELPLVLDVRVEATTTRQIAVRLAAIWRGLHDLDRGGEGNLTLGLLDDGLHPLARDCSLHEDHLAVVPGNHPAAGGRLLHCQVEPLSGLQRHGYS
jgi:hypothetical protein